MNKNDCCKCCWRISSLKVDAAEAVDGFESITGELKSGGDVRIVGFGTFLLLTVPLQQVEILEQVKQSKLKHQTAKFKAGSPLKDAVNN